MKIQKILPIFYIGLFTVFDPITFDFLVTALPLIASDLQITPGNLTGLISYYLLGVGFAQLWSGEFVDRYGQRLSVRIGAVAFLVFSCLVASSQNLFFWNIARFIMGMAVGLCITASLALVRENYAEEGGRILSIIYGAGNFVGVIAPLLAGLLITYYGWYSVLWAIASWGILLVLVAFLFFPRGNPNDSSPFSLTEWIKSYRHIFSVQEYRIWAVISALAYGCFLVFITGSSYVLTEGYGLTSEQYSYTYSFIIGVFVIGSFITQAFKPGIKLSRILWRWSVGLCLAAILIIVNALLWHEFYVFIAMIVVMSFVTAMLIPHGMALALLPFGNNEGKASAGIIITHVIIGASVGWAVTIGHRPDGLAIGVGILVQILGILWLLRIIKPTVKPALH